jgi:hypothetical protein
MPIPQNFVAFHGMGVRRYMNGRVASFLIGWRWMSRLRHTPIPCNAARPFLRRLTPILVSPTVHIPSAKFPSANFPTTNRENFAYNE